MLALQGRGFAPAPERNRILKFEISRDKSEPPEAHSSPIKPLHSQTYFSPIFSYALLAASIPVAPALVSAKEISSTDRPTDRDRGAGAASGIS